MKRGVVILLFSLIFISLIGIASAADINLCAQPSAVPQFNKISGDGINWAGVAGNINDENFGTSIGFKVGSACDSSPHGIMEGIVNFSNLANINKIEYKAKAGTSTIGHGSVKINVSLYYNGGWNQIDYYKGENSLSISKNVTGSWSNVSRVKVYLYSSENTCVYGCCYVDGYIYEIKAFGAIPPSCTPDCTGRQCGGDGCGGSCGSCSAEQTCSNGKCISIYSCYSPDDTIMKLFQPANSHGALWNDANYTHDICYSDIFGEVYTGASPHSCTGSNKVAGLFSAGNSHAEIPSLDNYAVDACYGNLTCTARDIKCNSDEKTVVALYQNNNSHLTDPNYKPVGIVSWWKFDEGSGITAIDSVVGNNGIINGSSVVLGKSGDALSFDGVNDYVEVADSQDLRLTKFTTEAWFKINSLPADGGKDFFILSKGENITPNGNFNYYIHLTHNSTLFGPGAKLSCGFENASDTNFRLMYNINSSYVNRFVHVACTLDGNTWKMYVDGKEVSALMSESKSCCSVNPISGLNGQVPSTASSNLYIGAAYSSSADGNGNDAVAGFFPGIIDEVAIYNRALTPEEIQNRYNMGMYEKKICCKSAPTAVPPTTEAYWANMLDTPINTADLKDSVKLIVGGSGLSGSINYTIYKEVKWWFDTKMSQSSSYGYTTWTAGLKNDSSLISGNNFYFIATLPDGTEKQSGYLNVSNIVNNAHPIAIIVKPVLDEKFKINTGISFEAMLRDEDDDLSASWDFGDGNTTTIDNCLTTGNCNTTHSYSRWGAKIITLTAKEMNRGQEAENYTRVLIYDEGINVFAIINEPPVGKILNGSRLVQFNASESFVANCITGSCPALPSYAKGSCYAVGDLFCYDFDNKLGIPNNYNLWFDWIFDDGETRYGNWTSSYGQVVEFGKLFYAPTKHWANLKVGYEAY